MATTTQDWPLGRKPWETNRKIFPLVNLCWFIKSITLVKSGAAKKKMLQSKILNARTAELKYSFIVMMFSNILRWPLARWKVHLFRYWPSYKAAHTAQIKIPQLIHYKGYVLQVRPPNRLRVYRFPFGMSLEWCITVPGCSLIVPTFPHH